MHRCHSKCTTKQSEPNSFDFLQFITTAIQPNPTREKIHFHSILRDCRIHKLSQPYPVKTYLNDSVLLEPRFTCKKNGAEPFIGLAGNCRATFVVCDRQFASYNMAFEPSSQVRDFSKLVVRGID